MNSNQENIVSMYREVIAFLERHNDVAVRLPGLGEYVEQLQSAIDGAAEHSLKQMTGWKGKTAEKRQRRETMTEKALDMSRRIRAYAMMTEDVMLAAEMNLSKRKFANMADTLVAGLAGRVIKQAREHAAGLVAYGTVPADADALEGMIEEYVATVPAPRAALATRKAHSEGLRRELKKGKEALEMIDMLVEIVRSEEISFYGSYRSVRRVIDHSTRHIAMRGKVTDAATGKGLSAVRIELMRNPEAVKLKNERELRKMIRNRELVMKKTKTKGGWWVKRLGDGEWHLRAILAGYETQEMTVYVVKGIMKVVDVRMERGGI